MKKASSEKPSARLDSIGIEAICAYVANGQSLRSWCRENGFAIQTVNDWIDADSSRSGQYARARDDRADAIFEDLDDLCDQAVRAETAVEVAGLRLKADTIKWKLARMSPKKYGDRTAVEHSGSVSLSSILEDIDGRDIGLPTAG